MKDWKTELRILFQMEDMPILETFITSLLSSQRESLVKEVESLPIGVTHDNQSFVLRDAVIEKIKTNGF